MAKPEDLADPYAGWLVTGLFGLVFLIFVYRMVLTSLRHFRHLVSLTHDKQNYFRVPNGAMGWWKEHILYAPLFRKRHTSEMTIFKKWGVGILPTRIQWIILILIIVANFILNLYKIPWNLPTQTMLLMFRNRTGVMAVVNMIPLVVMSGRNNPLIRILDISFDQFNLIHRWFGRIVIAQVLAHVVIWMYFKYVGGGWPAVGHLFIDYRPDINAAVVATGAFLLIPIQASSLLRHAFYETFLHVHQALAIITIVGIWIHLSTTPDAQIYIKAVIAAWVIERLIRFGTLIYRNLGKKGTQATIEVLHGEAMRVTLHMPRPWTVRPGQFLYLTVPSVGLWTSHPFSVAWSSEEPGAAFEMTQAAGNGKFLPADVEKGVSQTNIDPVLNGPTTHSISAVIRARNGFTSSLFKKASASSTGKITLSALVEGPYGNMSSMSSYGTVLLFAGGVGITHQLPYVRQLVAGAAGHTVATRRINLIWIIQSPEHLEWVRPWMTQVLAMDGRRDVLRITIFITRPRSAREVRSPSSTVRMYAGRPQISEIVSQEMQTATGAMGVGVCGPGGLGDDVRLAVREWTQVGEIDLLEESFSW